MENGTEHCALLTFEYACRNLYATKGAMLPKPKLEFQMFYGLEAVRRGQVYKCVIV